LILEYEVPRPPKETFFAALAIPGIIAGSLNTAVESSGLRDITIQNQTLKQQIQELNKFEQKSAKTIQKLSFLNSDDKSPKAGFSLIQTVFASDKEITKQEDGINLSSRRPIKEYLIIISTVATKDEVIEKAAELRSRFPNAVAVKADSDFNVLESDQPLTEYDATQRMLKLKRENSDLDLKLLKIE